MLLILFKLKLYFKLNKKYILILLLEEVFHYFGPKKD